MQRVCSLDQAFQTISEQYHQADAGCHELEGENDRCYGSTRLAVSNISDVRKVGERRVDVQAFGEKTSRVFRRE